jgi:hypothetical protein
MSYNQTRRMRTPERFVAILVLLPRTSARPPAGRSAPCSARVAGAARSLHKSRDWKFWCCRRHEKVAERCIQRRQDEHHTTKVNSTKPDFCTIAPVFPACDQRSCLHRHPAPSGASCRHCVGRRTSLDSPPCPRGVERRQRTADDHAHGDSSPPAAALRPPGLGSRPTHGGREYRYGSRGPSTRSSI